MTEWIQSVNLKEDVHIFLFSKLAKTTCRLKIQGTQFPNYLKSQSVAFTLSRPNSYPYPLHFYRDIFRVLEPGRAPSSPRIQLTENFPSKILAFSIGNKVVTSMIWTPAGNSRLGLRRDSHHERCFGSFVSSWVQMFGSTCEFSLSTDADG